MSECSYCIDCGKEIEKGQIYCKDCYWKHRAGHDKKAIHYRRGYTRIMMHIEQARMGNKKAK